MKDQTKGRKPVESKECVKCKGKKPLFAFSHSKRYSDGYEKRCKACANMAIQNKHPERFNKLFSTYET